MNLNFKGTVAAIFAVAVFSFLNCSCVNVNQQLGQSYLATDQQYDIYTAELSLDDIELRQPDSLSCYSLYRFSFGAVRDPQFGLTTRAAAFTLVPVADTLDFGKPGTQVFRQFHFSAVSDSVSCADPSQQYILQNVNVYELEQAIDVSRAYPKLHIGKKRITRGIPVYNGADSLSFDFSEEFARKYMSVRQDELDSISHYTKRFPGIYIDCDLPRGEGGRINMFKLPVDVYQSVMYGSYAVLKFSAEYDSRGVIDTSFIYYLGPLSKYNMREITSTSPTNYPQLAFNLSEHQSKSMEGKAGKEVLFEGGRGLKPVIMAGDIRTKLLAEISKHGDPEKVVINKANLDLPFDFPDNWEDISLYPSILSPTCRILSDQGNVSYAGITNSSSSDDDEGLINRSLCVYAPDISHHIQELLTLKDVSKIDNYNIWLLAMAEEIVTSASSSSSSSSDYSDYLQYLAYSSYYNSMYNGYGGYGGYGYGGYGYGGYGSYYNNYYNYMLMAQMYAASSNTQTQETQTLLDYHRFYNGHLHGPASKSGKPKLRIVYSVPKG